MTLSNKYSHGIFPILILAIIPGLAIASKQFDQQSHDEIRAAVTSLVLDEAGDNAQIQRISLDSRLRLRQCEQPLETFWPPGSRKSGSASIGVSCDGAMPWKIFVPVRIRVTKPVLVAARPLLRGDILSEADVMMVEKDVSRLGGNYVLDITPFLGYEIRQQVNEERVIRANMFKAPKLIKRGDSVTLIAGRNGFEVTVGGKALADGSKGARISVRNVKSKRVVQGEVISKGVVRVY